MFDNFSLWYNHWQLEENLWTVEKPRQYSHLPIGTEAPLICLKWFGISRLHLQTGVPHMLHLFKHCMSSIWSYASYWKHSEFTSILCVTIIEVPLDWFHADPLWARAWRVCQVRRLTISTSVTVLMSFCLQYGRYQSAVMEGRYFTKQMLMHSVTGNQIWRLCNYLTRSVQLLHKHPHGRANKHTERLSRSIAP